MKQTYLRQTGCRALVILMLAVFAQIAVFAQDASKGARALEGSWSVQVTIRNCLTGGVIRSIPRMITFAQGGTLHEYAVAGSSTAPVNRGPGHGVWTRSFERNFSYSLEFFRLNGDTTYGGYIRETRAVEVDDSGNAFTATGTGAVYNADGTLAFPTCSTEAGVRFE